MENGFSRGFQTRRHGKGSPFQSCANGFEKMRSFGHRFWLFLGTQPQLSVKMRFRVGLCAWKDLVCLMVATWMLWGNRPKGTLTWLAHTWMLCENGGNLFGRYQSCHMDVLWERTEFVWTLSWSLCECSVGMDGVCVDLNMVGTWMLSDRTEFVWTLSWLPHGCSGWILSWCYHCYHVNFIANARPPRERQSSLHPGSSPPSPLPPPKKKSSEIGRGQGVGYDSTITTPTPRTHESKRLGLPASADMFAYGCPVGTYGNCLDASKRRNIVED